ncbi:MAG: alanine--tRNA ligase [Candidatus Nealsonbacteria bacterium]|nr:MAG: alanine--tRNA ligase [Candidatus Nealsonbacteria bacterium]
MTSEKLRQDFLRFFEKKGHKIVPSSSLLPVDPSVLFTSAGMQQFKEYYTGKESPYGNKVVSCQKCFRTSDIEEVGDAVHLTFLEMLGNFSFGDYFKEEAMKMSLELLTKIYKIPPENLWFTYFKGSKEVPEDKESKQIWQKLGIKEERIHGFGKEDNFWGPTGKSGPCGPTTEIHYDLTQKPCQKKKKCLPNCQCGRFVEIWNLVFNEYNQSEDKNLTLLKKKGVDTGMGLERLAMVSQEKLSVFETDLFEPIIKKIENESQEPYSQNPKPYRIIADHVKASVFLIAEGSTPSNVEQGYILRRVLRRAIRFGELLGFPQNFLIPLAKKVIGIYGKQYPEVKSRETDILTVIQKEEEKFRKTLERGLKQFKKIASLGDISGADAFHLFDTYGFPLELTEELAKERGLEVDKEGFEESFSRHKEISRAGAEKKFGGVGREASYESARLHTATHLLHAALRQILGNHVRQKGSDITPQRLRFDFTHPQKMTDQELKEVEDLVNRKIQESLEVRKEDMSYEEALKKGALSFFKEKYPGKVSVYSIGDFSKEICAGPHVENTVELGHFKIVKEESSGAGVRRIRAILE